MAAFSACVQKETPEPGQPFKEATVLEIADARFTAVNSGDSKTFRLNVDGDFEVLVEDGPWLETEATDSSLTITIVGPLSDSQERKATVTLKSGKLAESIAVTLKKAAAMDWSFDALYSEGGNMAVFENTEFGVNSASFTHEAGTSPFSGYGRLDFASDASFSKKMADGFTLETVFAADQLPSTGMMCALGCFYEGGFLLGVSGRDSNERIVAQLWLDGKPVSLSSGNSIKSGSYHHVVCTWDADAGLARLWVDAEPVDSCKAGSFALPATKTAQWLAIGANCSKTDPLYAWNGEIVSAKVHDAVFDRAEVARRCAALPLSSPAHVSGLGKVSFLPQCAIAEGSSFRLSAHGLLPSDKLELYDISAASPQSWQCSISNNVASFGPGLREGAFRLDFTRDALTTPLGVVELRLCDPSCASRRPKVIAHRGVHNSGAPENSIAALKLAQQAGYYASETDIWLSSDDSLMINHDGRIGGYDVQTTPYSTLRTVKLSNGEALPSLSEYLRQASKSQSTKLIIEIKDHKSSARTLEATRAAVEMVERMCLKDHVEYIAFSHDACLLIRELDGNATIGYLNGDRDPETLRDEGIDIMDYSSSVILKSKPDYVDRGHKIGVGTNVWTVNDRETMMKCIALCADYITTDCPDVAEEIADQLF